MNRDFSTGNHRFDNRAIEEESFNKTIKELKQQLKEKKTRRIETETPLLSPRKNRKQPEYLIELSEQIKEKEESRVQEREERLKPAVSQGMSGYPNLPVITCEEIRAKKIAQVQAFKTGLDIQLHEKLNNKKRAAEENAEIEKSVIQMAHHKYKSLDNLNRLKKEREKDLLDAFWKKGELTKKLKDLVENPHKTRRNDWFDQNLINSERKSANKSFLPQQSRIKEKANRNEYQKKIDLIVSAEKHKKNAHNTPKNSKF